MSLTIRLQNCAARYGISNTDAAYVVTAIKAGLITSKTFTSVTDNITNEQAWKIILNADKYLYGTDITKKQALSLIDWDSTEIMKDINGIGLYSFSSLTSLPCDGILLEKLQIEKKGLYAKAALLGYFTYEDMEFYDSLEHVIEDSTSLNAIYGNYIRSIDKTEQGRYIPNNYCYRAYSKWCERTEPAAYAVHYTMVKNTVSLIIQI